MDWCRFQSTPPRGRRHFIIYVNSIVFGISIHSAARAETTEEGFVADARQIFQSTPPRGRRRSFLGDSATLSIFQSTPPRGRRPSRPWFAQTTLRISIHSAARAETFPPPLYYVPHTDFNPLRREGGDGNQDGNRCLHRDFNPLRREGGDVMQEQIKVANHNFNPLRREGGDFSRRSINSTCPRFQSTPPRGRRPLSSCL